MKSRHVFLLAAATVALLFGYAARSTAADDRTRDDRPNIVLFMADDVGSEVLGCYGGTSYETPRIDALARRGARFTHCYSMPVCHPSRLAIMTGRYPFRNPAGWGKWPKGVETFAHVLGRAGYATAVAGKWQLTFLAHNPDHADELGFDQAAVFGWHEGPRFHNPMIYRNGEVWEEKQRPEVYGPEVYTEFLIDFIERNRERPFLVYYPMALCHEISDDFEPVPPPAPDGHYLTFAEMVADMDDAVGRIVDAVDRLGLARNTVIMFTTDNGSPSRYLTEVEHRDGKIIRRHKPVVSVRNGEEVRGGKGSLTDAGTRVPLVVRWPAETPSGVCIDDLVDFSDFLPTLADLAGASLPEGVEYDGHSFAPQLRGEQGDPREWVYSGLRGRHWVRTRCWKLYADGRLFNVCDDAAEKQPIDKSEAPAEAKAARRKLQAVLEELGVAK
jgi:arylsulfatase A